MTPERAEYSQFLGPNQTENIAFIAKKTTSENVIHPSLLPQFNGSIGVSRGDEFGKEHSQYVLNVDHVKDKLVNVKTNQDHVAMLLRGRLDGMFYEEMSARRLLASSMVLNQNYSIRFTFQGTPVYWGVNHRFVSVEIRRKLNQAWLSMLHQNMIEPVYKKYGLAIDMSKFDFDLIKLLDEVE
jgi:ABC-type amino acid transport substrate-binding protein